MEKFHLHHVKTAVLIIFLEKYGFIRTNVSHRKLKLSSSTLNFIREIRLVEETANHVEISSLRF